MKNQTREIIARKKRTKHDGNLKQIRKNVRNNGTKGKSQENTEKLIRKFNKKKQILKKKLQRIAKN